MKDIDIKALTKRVWLIGYARVTQDYNEDEDRKEQAEAYRAVRFVLEGLEELGYKIS